MGSEIEVTNLLNSIYRNYSFLAQSAKSHSGGLAIGWNHLYVKILNSWGSTSCAGIHVHWDESNLLLNILNVYDPYDNRVSFWDKLCTSPQLKNENVILGGDLNFTL